MLPAAVLASGFLPYRHTTATLSTLAAGQLSLLDTISRGSILELSLGFRPSIIKARQFVLAQ
jgi:hypothetical protein